MTGWEVGCGGVTGWGDEDVSNALSEPNQYGGGHNCGSTAVASVVGRALVDASEYLKCSCAVLFLDVKLAFLTMRRDVCVPGTFDKDEHCNKLLEWGLPESDAIDICKGFSG